EDVFNSRAGKVSLLTLHAAKGLEFPVVFIVGCESGLLPLKADLLTTSVEEERRLFYVGMTRARERLYLVRSRQRTLFGRATEPAASPFLQDILERMEDVKARGMSRRRAREKEQFKLF
ncbi:MAG: ATP-binding domain-containing protein, partial [Candidatus Omnitrophica bacterium]|nr:ATP-binding domain-containing protein [Candidatus Omnitrophota bacterium]